MKAVVCSAPGRLELTERTVPQAKKGHAILKIRRVGVCGTDLHAVEGTQPFFNYPRILGHELAGELLEGDHRVGSSGGFFTVIPYWNCGSCIACRCFKPNCCTELRVCGVHIDGGMTEFLSVPADMLVPGEGLSLDELALVEPLAIGAHSVRRAAVEQGEFVVVMGAGPIGLGVMQFCQLRGANVIALDVDDRRLGFCRTKMGIDHAINPSACDPTEEIRRITSNDMATAVFDATGNLRAINGGLANVAHGGRYVLVGLQKGDIQISHPEFHKRECTMMSSRNALKEDFQYVMSCMRSKMIDPVAFITHRLSFDDLAVELRELKESTELLVKAMINIGDPKLKSVVL